jgi:hypothetical protein
LKEDGLVRVKWIPTAENSVDVFTKNLFGPLYEKHIKVYVGKDQYMQYEGTDWTLVAQKKKHKTERGHGKAVTVSIAEALEGRVLEMSSARLARSLEVHAGPHLSKNLR